MIGLRPRRISFNGLSTISPSSLGPSVEVDAVPLVEVAGLEVSGVSSVLAAAYLPHNPVYVAQTKINVSRDKEDKWFK